MLLKTRVARRGIDTHRLGKALARPGMDTRSWVSEAVILAFKLDDNEGAFADVALLPSLEEETVRVGAFYAGPGFGFYAPLEKDDRVIVSFPGGDPGLGGTVVARLWSASDPPSATAKDNKADVSLHIQEGVNLRIAVTGAGKVLLGEAGKATKAVARKADPVDLGQFAQPVAPGPIVWLPPGVDPLAVPPPIPVTIGPSFTSLTGQVKAGSSKVEASD